MFPTLYEQCEGSLMSLSIYYVNKGCEVGLQFIVFIPED